MFSQWIRKGVSEKLRMVQAESAQGRRSQGTRDLRDQVRTLIRTALLDGLGGGGGQKSEYFRKNGS